MNFYFVNEKTQYENSGDALINRELITLLRKSGKVFANCPKECPDFFIEELELNKEEIIRSKKSVSFTLKIISRAIRSIISSDSVYVFGGLGDANGENISSAFKDILVSLVYCIYRLIGIRIIVIGKSFGTQGKLNKMTTRFRSLLVNEYYVRDLKSLEYCHSIEIKKAKYCPDLSWQMESFKKNVNQGGVVLATFRIPPHIKNAESYEQRLIEKLEIILDEIHNQLRIDIDLVLAYQVKKDIKVMRRIQKAVETRGGVLEALCL